MVYNIGMWFFVKKPALALLALAMLMSNVYGASFDFHNGNIDATGSAAGVSSKSVNGVTQYLSWNGEEIVKPIGGYPAHFTDKDLVERNGKYYLRTGNYTTPVKEPIPAAPLKAQANPEAKKSPGMTFGSTLAAIAIGLFLVSRKRS